MVHPTAATYVNNYGTSGDAAKIVAGKKVYKYGETCDELGYDLIPFAIETYGKFGTTMIVQNTAVTFAREIDGFTT